MRTGTTTTSPTTDKPNEAASVEGNGNGTALVAVEPPDDPAEADKLLRRKCGDALVDKYEEEDSAWREAMAALAGLTLGFRFLHFRSECVAEGVVMRGRKSSWLSVFGLLVKSKHPLLGMPRARRFLRSAERYEELIDFDGDDDIVTVLSPFKNVGLDALYKSLLGSPAVRQQVIDAATSGRLVTTKMVSAWISEEEGTDTSKPSGPNAKGIGARASKRAGKNSAPDELKKQLRNAITQYNGPKCERDQAIQEALSRHQPNIDSSEQLKNEIEHITKKRFKGSTAERRAVIQDVAKPHAEPIKTVSAFRVELENTADRFRGKAEQKRTVITKFAGPYVAKTPIESADDLAATSEAVIKRFKGTREKRDQVIQDLAMRVADKVRSPEELQARLESLHKGYTGSVNDESGVIWKFAQPHAPLIKQSEQLTAELEMLRKRCPDKRLLEQAAIELVHQWGGTIDNRDALQGEVKNLSKRCRVGDDSLKAIIAAAINVHSRSRDEQARVALDLREMANMCLLDPEKDNPLSALVGTMIRRFVENASDRFDEELITQTTQELLEEISNEIGRGDRETLEIFLIALRDWFNTKARSREEATG